MFNLPSIHPDESSFQITDCFPLGEPRCAVFTQNNTLAATETGIAPLATRRRGNLARQNEFRFTAAS